MWNTDQNGHERSLLNEWNGRKSSYVKKDQSQMEHHTLLKKSIFKNKEKIVKWQTKTLLVV